MPTVVLEYRNLTSIASLAHLSTFDGDNLCKTTYKDNKKRRSVECSADRQRYLQQDITEWCPAVGICFLGAAAVAGPGSGARGHTGRRAFSAFPGLWARPDPGGRARSRGPAPGSQILLSHPCHEPRLQAMVG